MAQDSEPETPRKIGRYVGILCLLLLLGILTWWVVTAAARTRLQTVEVVEASPGTRRLMWFPVAGSGDTVRLPRSYLMIRDGIGSRVSFITPSRPRSIPLRWEFDQQLTNERIGIVVRTVIARKINDSDVRVLWLEPAEFQKCVAEGRLTVPPFDHLENADPKLLKLVPTKPGG